MFEGKLETCMGNYISASWDVCEWKISNSFFCFWTNFAIYNYTWKKKHSIHNIYTKTICLGFSFSDVMPCFKTLSPAAGRRQNHTISCLWPCFWQLKHFLHVFIQFYKWQKSTCQASFQPLSSRCESLAVLQEKKKILQEESLEIDRWFKPPFLSFYHRDIHENIVETLQTNATRDRLCDEVRQVSTSSSSGPVLSAACCRNNLLSARRHLLGLPLITSVLSFFSFFFSSFCRSSFNQPSYGLFMDLMKPQIFMRQLIYGHIKDGCFPFDERGLI